MVLLYLQHFEGDYSQAHIYGACLFFRGVCMP